MDPTFPTAKKELIKKCLKDQENFFVRVEKLFNHQAVATIDSLSSWDRLDELKKKYPKYAEGDAALP